MKLSDPSQVSSPQGEHSKEMGLLKLELDTRVTSWGNPLSGQAGGGSPPSFLAPLSTGLGVSPAHASPAQTTCLRPPYPGNNRWPPFAWPPSPM